MAAKAPPSTSPRSDPTATLHPPLLHTSSPLATIPENPIIINGPDQSQPLTLQGLHKADSAKSSLSPKSNLKTTPASSIPRLTGAAAMAENKRRNQRIQQKSASVSRRTSPNPAVEVTQSLVSGGGMSKAGDAPTSEKLSSPHRSSAEKITVPIINATTSSEEVSPVSVGSLGTIESSGAGTSLTATAEADVPAPGSHFVAEPAQMTDEPGPMSERNGNLAVDDQGGIKAFSYPGPPTSQPESNQDTTPARGMSLPGYGQQSPKSPAPNRRHKCPYCETVFTRHHNLKSHLLTHSQEKPYICHTCQSRFRRLHDLKRHTKLHTGERPHICDKCGRRFARGDALARHNKGPGGCAGRRSSFGGDDDGIDGDGEGMDGVEYADGYEEGDGQGRRVSEPSRKRHHAETLDDTDRHVYQQHGSTYPPAPVRNIRGESVGGMAPPTVIHPGSGTVTSPRDMSNHPSPAAGSSMGSAYYGSGQVFGEPGIMTQSPKPLSPGQIPDGHRLSVGDASLPGRNRSTSLTQQFQQHQYGRGSVGGRASPHMSSQYLPNNQSQSAAMLPPLGSSAVPPVGARALQPSSIPNAPLQGPGAGSNPSSLSSHGHSSGGSLREIIAQDGGDIWSYVRQLESRHEARVVQLESRLAQSENRNAQLEARNAMLEGRLDRMQSENDIRFKNHSEDIRSIRGSGTLSAAPSYSSDMARAY